MNRTDAKVWLTRETAASCAPVISSDELDLLLNEVSRTKDGAEYFDRRALYQAVGRGWGWKASASAEYYGIESDIHRHCVERQKFYSTRAASGGSVAKIADTDAVRNLL
jgi:hypothetical protein